MCVEGRGKKLTSVSEPGTEGREKGEDTGGRRDEEVKSGRGDTANGGQLAVSPHQNLQT